MNATIPSPTTRAVQRRFFDALASIQESGGIVGLQTFCNRYGLNRTKYSRVRTSLANDTTGRYHHIDMDALAYIVADYNVNAEWLLTGHGDMFRSCATNLHK